MDARVKQDHRWKSVTAFSGVEFVKAEYREVPKGFEKEAQAHPFLEIGTVKAEKTQEEKAAWAAKMVQARADKKAKKGG